MHSDENRGSRDSLYEGSCIRPSHLARGYAAHRQLPHKVARSLLQLPIRLEDGTADGHGHIVFHSNLRDAWGSVVKTQRHQPIVGGDKSAHVQTTDKLFTSIDSLRPAHRVSRLLVSNWKRSNRGGGGGEG